GVGVRAGGRCGYRIRRERRRRVDPDCVARRGRRIIARHEHEEGPMTTAAAPPATYGLDASIPPWAVPRYQRMIETGILTGDDKVELLENYVVLKMPRNPRHDSSVQRMLRPLLGVLPTGWDIRIQLAVTLLDSQPEPDFAIVRGSATNYEA